MNTTCLLFLSTRCIINRRVEPGVKFSCDIDFDPFRLMQERDIKYGKKELVVFQIYERKFYYGWAGFTIALEEYLATVPTLWYHTIEFAKTHPQYIYPPDRPDSLVRMVTNDEGESYNLCHFWSNFEIASVSFMRSEGYQAYFKYLDQAGGFFYERYYILLLITSFFNSKVYLQPETQMGRRACSFHCSGAHAQCQRGSLVL